MSQIKKTGAVVEMKLSLTNQYVGYTSTKNPVTLEMGKSLSAYLKRQGSSGRLVSYPDGKIIDEW
jgi:hypothetical protein